MSHPIQQALQRPRECPELLEFLAAMELAEADPRRQAAEQHRLQCASCQTEWSMYCDFERAEPRADEQASVDYVVRQLESRRKAGAAATQATPFRGIWQRLWASSWSPAWMGGAALAAVALILTIGLANQWRSRHPALDAGDHQTFRSQSIEIVTPLQDLLQPPAEIAWKPVQGAAAYTLKLSEVDGSQVFYTNVTVSALPLPDQPRKLLTQGKVLLLGISALDSAGNEIAHSGTVRIRVNSGASRSN